MKPMINKTITIVPARMPPIMAPTFELLSLVDFGSPDLGSLVYLLSKVLLGFPIFCQ
jgi:hypothetical protein